MLRRRAITDFWHHLAEVERLSITANDRGESSDLFEALAHHRRKAFSALTAVPDLTLDMLYPATLVASLAATAGAGALDRANADAHAGTHPRYPLHGAEITSSASSATGGVRPFDTRHPPAKLRGNRTKRGAPSTSQEIDLPPVRRQALSGKSARRRTRIRDTVSDLPEHEGA